MPDRRASCWPDAFRQLEFSPDGKSLVGGNGLSFSVWDIKREEKQIVLARPARAIKVDSSVRFVGFDPTAGLL